MARKQKRKWGKLSSIDYSTRVGTPAWYAAHPSSNIRKLSAYRYLHLLKGDHKPVRRRARRLKRKPSSAMTGKEMVSTALRWQRK